MTTTDDIIEYGCIDNHARFIDKSNEIRVLLSRRQASLFRKKLHLLFGKSPQSGARVSLDFLKLAGVQLLIFMTCPRLAFLADYYEVDRHTLARIQFHQHDRGVLVVFIPKKSSME